MILNVGKINCLMSPVKKTTANVGDIFYLIFLARWRIMNVGNK